MPLWLTLYFILNYPIHVSPLPTHSVSHISIIDASGGVSPDFVYSLKIRKMLAIKALGCIWEDFLTDTTKTPENIIRTKLLSTASRPLGRSESRWELPGSR